MVAAPETKVASEVVVSKDVAQDPPSSEELKSKAVEKMECVENDVEKPEDAEPSGSKEISSENSAKLEKAAEMLAAGKKALLQSQPQQAVDALAEACALQSAVHGDMSNTMCEFYYHYGRALLDLARIEGDVLGNALSGVPEGEDMESSQVEDPDKLTDDKADKDEEADEEEEEGDEAEEEGEETADDTQEGQEDEDVPSLQLAWEVLELAKTIYEKNEKLSDDDKTKLSQVYLKLGEVSLENENYPESINMYTECLKLQKSILPADDRWLAETHYQLGLAHSLADNFDEAVQHLQSAITVIQERIKNVSQGLEKEDVKITDESDVSGLSPEQKARVADVKELQKLLPELQEKMTDIKDTKASFTEKLKAMKEFNYATHFSGQLSGGSSGKSAFEDGSSSSFSADGAQKDAKPISTSLIRKKRKPDEEAASSEAKKPRTEDDSNGATEAPAQQKEEEKKEVEEAPKTKEDEKMDVQPSDAKEES